MCAAVRGREVRGGAGRQQGLRIEAISFSTMAARWCDLYDESACGDFITFAMRATLEEVASNHPLPPSLFPKHFYSPHPLGWRKK